MDTRRRRERGATMVEAAFVAPVFFLLIFGVFEFGFLFRNWATVNNAASEGARAASIAGDRATSDYETLVAIRHGFAAMGAGNNMADLDYVVIYAAAGPEDEVPNACRASSVAGLCNRYEARHFYAGDGDPEDFGCIPPDHAWNGGSPSPALDPGDERVDLPFCPLGRDVALPDTDYVGVYVQAQHQAMTGFVGWEQMTLDSNVVIRLEPDRRS